MTRDWGVGARPVTAPRGGTRSCRGWSQEAALRMLVNNLGIAVDHFAKGLPAAPRTVVLAGSGEFLAQMVLGEQKAFAVPAVVSFAERLGSAISQAACAYALAVLATERADGR